MKIVKEPKGVVFTVTGQGLSNSEKVQLSEIIKEEKRNREKKALVLAPH